MAWTLRVIHNVADFVTFSLSFGANILLLWLIVFKTSKEFKVYSRVLTLSALSDAMFAVLSIVGSPRVIISHNTLFLIADGFHHYLDYVSAAYVHALTAAATVCVMHCTAIQFLFRYFLLCRERPLTDRDVGKLCAAVLILSAVAYGVFVWSASPAEAVAQENGWKLTSDPMWADDTPAFLAFTYGETKSNVIIAVLVLQGSMDFWCLVYTSYRIQQFLNEARRSMSKQTANMHSQMTRVLYGQAFIPFIALCMPLLGAFVSMMAGDYIHNHVNVIMMCCMSTTAICVLNPVSTIYFVPAYRNTVLAWLPFCRKKSNGRVTKTVLTAPSTHRYPTFSRRGL